MNFTKMQGAGNDFVLVETSDMRRDWSQLAIAMCDRHYGVGADGLLLLLPSNNADCRMRIINADGSEAEACGNGIRCLVKYAVDRGIIRTRTGGISVETISGVRKVDIHKTTADSNEIQVSMGGAKFKAEEIPVMIEQVGGNLIDKKSMIGCFVTVDGRELLLHLVSMGNPHAVYFWQRPLSEFPLSQLGPKIEQHNIFPKGINFEVARVVNRQKIEARVWERGAGETLACGSGACAIAITAQLYEYIDKKVDVKLPGGILTVEWDGVGEVLLSGPAEKVFTGEWPD